MGSHQGPAAPSSGAPKPDQRRLLILAGGVTGTVVAWGFLVYAAIDFGGQARNGEGAAWIFLILASLGAMACLFLAMMLGVRAASAFRAHPPQPPPPRPTPGGGKRIKRD